MYARLSSLSRDFLLVILYLLQRDRELVNRLAKNRLNAPAWVLACIIAYALIQFLINNAINEIYPSLGC